MISSTNNVYQGKVLLKESPFVYGLKSSLRDERCDFCFSSGKVLKCTACRYVGYCNRICQEMGWEMHKDECPRFQKVHPKILPDAARILSRLIFKLKKRGGSVRGYYTQTSFRVFKDLMSHYPDIKKDKKRMEHFVALYHVLLEFVGEENLPNSAELLGMYGRLVVNGFSILSPEMISIGTGIYLAVSIIDHSCDPNAVAVFEGPTILVRSLVHLPTLDWSKIFISYIEMLNSTQERQQELLATYYFLCECSRCKDIGEAKITNAIMCPNNNCSAPIDPEDIAKDLSGSFACSKCKEYIKPQLHNKYLQVRSFVSQQLQNMKEFTYLDVAKVCLQKQEDLFHPLNLQRVKVLDAAFESSISLGHWEEAECFGLLLIPGFRYYYGEFHPLTGLLQMKIGKILICMEREVEALPFLDAAKEVLLVTHGREHSFYNNQLLGLYAQVEASFNKVEEPPVEPPVEPQVESNLNEDESQSQAGSQGETQGETQGESQGESQGETQGETQGESQAETQVESQAESQVESSLNKVE